MLLKKMRLTPNEKISHTFQKKQLHPINELVNKFSWGEYVFDILDLRVFFGKSADNKDSDYYHATSQENRFKCIVREVESMVGDTPFETIIKEVYEKNINRK